MKSEEETKIKARYQTRLIKGLKESKNSDEKNGGVFHCHRKSVLLRECAIV